MKTNLFTRARGLLVLLLLTIVTTYAWGGDIVLNKAAITALKNNDYGDFNSSATDFTVSDTTFTGYKIAYNANGTPSGIANGQFIQMQKTNGYIINKYATNLSSITIIAYNTNIAVSSGTESSNLSSETLPTPVDETVGLYTYSSKNKTVSKTTTNYTLKKYTISLTGKKFVKVAANSSGAAQIYSITITTAPSCSPLGAINGSLTVTFLTLGIVCKHPLLSLNRKVRKIRPAKRC